MIVVKCSVMRSNNDHEEQVISSQISAQEVESEMTLLKHKPVNVVALAGFSEPNRLSYK